VGTLERMNGDLRKGGNYTDGAIGSREIGHGSRIRWT